MRKKLPLRSFRLQNFKAVRDSGTVSFGPLTVFIGNNGSGKSSLIEGLETFRDVVVDGLDAAMARWRGFEHVWNRATKHELLQPSGQRPHLSEPMTFHAHLRAGNTSLRVKQAITLGEGGNELFFLEDEFIESNGLGSIRKSDNTFAITLGKIPATQEPAPSMPKGHSVLRYWQKDELLERWQFLALVPEAMGQPTPQQRAAGWIRLAKNGANVAEYLNEIRKTDADAFNGIVESLRYVLPFAQDLQPTLAAELQREFYLKLKEGDFEVPGWLLSTGTLRIVALLACLRHPDPPPLLVVEEIENGLDPRTLHLLVEEIRAAITAGTTQVILTTHSPYLLDLLDLSHIVVVEREEGQPVFRRPDAGALADWANSFAPGRLYTMGRLTREDR